jgi:hypothetical protein
MKKRVLLVGLILALILTVAVPASLAWADPNGSVTCTVSAEKLVSVLVSDGNVNFGTLDLGEEKSTAFTGDTDTQTITNNGNVQVNFRIGCSDAIHTTEYGTDWDLSGNKGTDSFFLKAKGGDLSDFTALTNAVSDTILDQDIDPSQYLSLDLQIGMPTSVSDFTLHNITISILAYE